MKAGSSSSGWLCRDTCHRQCSPTLSSSLPTMSGATQLAAMAAHPVEGRSFAGLWTGGGHQGRKWICGQKGKEACVRSRNWKLLSNGRLFDLVNDGNETRPIPPGKETPESKAARERLTGTIQGCSRARHAREGLRQDRRPRFTSADRFGNL